MAKKHLRTLGLLLAVFAFASVLLIGCARPGTVGTTQTASSTPSCAATTTVKTGLTSFETTCVTFAKGQSLKIVQDQMTLHIFDYGAWNGASAVAETPAGAPALKDLTLSGESVTIGPFTTAGTFHIYCTVHSGMDLTVIVK